MAATLQVGAPADITTPSAGERALFVNSEANYMLYYKLSDGSVEAVPGVSSGDAGVISEMWMESIKCALNKGLITAAEYQSIISTGLTINSSSTTDEDGNTTSSYSIGSRDVAIISITLDAATYSGSALATHQITTTFNPTNASNRTLTYVTSDATKATVSATGLITLVASGSAIISVIPNGDPTKAKTVTVTIS